MKKLIYPTRRKFLAQTAFLGCSAAASPFITPMTLAAAPWDHRLVVIILRGAMDGLDVVRPYTDPMLKIHRPVLGSVETGYDLDGRFALHEGLSDLIPLWQSKELAFAHAVSTPYRDKRSHFVGQDLLEAGTGMDVPIGMQKQGWLNRMLGHVPGVTAETAFAVGRNDMFILNGEAPSSSWSPDARLELSSQGRRLLDQIYHDDPLFADSANRAADLAQTLDMGGIREDDEGEMMMSGDIKRTLLKAQKSAKASALAAFAASRMNEETRIAAFSIGGWDTHRSQPNALGRSLAELSDAILTLKSTLGANWQKTSVLAMTEFGRTVRENGTAGTDHGTGGLMVMAGGAINGGKIYGDWPGLGEGDLYQDRDLMPTGDVRSYAAWAMRGMFGLDNSDLEGHIFPDLQMGRDPGILA